jgi:hypothetical protein
MHQQCTSNEPDAIVPCCKVKWRVLVDLTRRVALPRSESRFERWRGSAADIAFDVERKTWSSTVADENRKHQTSEFH